MFGVLEVDDELGTVAVGAATVFADSALDEIKRIVIWFVVPIAVYPHAVGCVGDGVGVGCGWSKPLSGQSWSSCRFHSRAARCSCSTAVARSGVRLQRFFQ